MSKRPNELYIEDIRKSCSLITDSIGGHDLHSFKESVILFTAVCKWLEIIGEASRQIDDDFKDKHKEIPWRKMVGMRNFLVHVYHNLDVSIVWKAATESIPELYEKVSDL